MSLLCCCPRLCPIHGLNDPRRPPVPNETQAGGDRPPVFVPSWSCPSRLDEAQVGGDHYRKHRMTPWEIIDEYKLGFYDGNALKYILRANEKGGVEDLKKARHYLDKLIDLQERKP